MGKLVIDTRPTEIMFVDKANRHYAEDKDVVKYILKPEERDSKKFKIAEFVGKSYGLSGLQLAFYSIFAAYLTERKKVTTAIVIYTYKKVYGVRGRNKSWYYALKRLLEQKILYQDDDGYISLFSAYKLPKNVDTAKFMIIELDADDTSAPITI